MELLGELGDEMHLLNSANHRFTQIAPWRPSSPVRRRRHVSPVRHPPVVARHVSSVSHHTPALCPPLSCCQPSVAAVTCQSRGWPANMLDIPDAAAARPAHPLHRKFRVKYPQVKLITRIQERGQRAYLQDMFMWGIVGN